ncbi:ATP-binding protein [Streptantibioticus ferralitis]|uniref:ATP-binding protein n=1 Tax=Streptantibioticus ferralitis TaxID=236510 RepID=A0ABT5Z041_9ACTN|nr:ATP-binding protein [Streptantibioticus ferralitis]MDF2257200.1 ATP-binding protein [Streptantibioticus ferralitis]
MAEAGIKQYRQELAAVPKALAGIRRIVAAYLRLWGRAELTAPAALCTTELLSNVAKHAGSPDCVLTLQRRSDAVRVTVSDTSRALPVVTEPDWCGQSGRGMFLLAKTADAWGANPTEDGKDVWFEFRTTSRESAA